MTHRISLQNGEMVKSLSCCGDLSVNARQHAGRRGATTSVASTSPSAQREIDSDSGAVSLAREPQFDPDAIAEDLAHATPAAREIGQVADRRLNTPGD
jgi:hypothetical protein